MSTDTKVKTLIINKLTQEQYDSSTHNATELYLTPDDSDAKFEEINKKIDEIELFKFPNAIITGNPTIDHGQVSSFSNVDFLQFPFLVDLTNRRFRAEFCFTTGDDVTTQQNILDSEFGLALAIKNGKGLMAIGHNGTSWAGQVVGSINIQPRTTYYANLTWSRINYQTQLSTNGTDYTADMNFGSTQSPYPRTMFIGGSPDLFGTGTAHPFKGSINLNKCFLYIEEQLVWQGMDDAGLATRADVSLDNLDAAGQAKFDAKQDVGDYATRAELPTIAAANKPGLVAGGNWLTVNQQTGKMECGQLTKEQYNSALGYTFISKTTLENRIVDKQDTLVSGTNIKTINNESILGEGNIEIKGGSDNAFTPDNLLGGEGIEIVPEPVEGGIDEYTLACFHFDDGLNYETIDGIKETIVDYDGNARTTSSYYKFGTKSCYSNGGPNVARIENPSLSLNNDFTIDFWIYRTSSDLGYIGLCNRNEINSSDRCCVFGCNYSSPYILIKNSNGTSRIYMTSEELPINKWTHVAITYDSSNEYGKLACFIDGVKKIEEDTILKNEVTFSKYMFVQAVGQGYIDELRYSNIVRYTSDFTPMNKPYSVDVPTGNYVINSTTPYITEQYDDGQGNGYRVWSNKFCEQWGFIDNGQVQSSTSFTVNFPKEYRDKKYSHFIGNARGDSWNYKLAQGVADFSTTGMTFGFYWSDGGGRYFCWKAEGYIL